MARVPYAGAFRWSGVPLHPYKEEGSHFRDVTRQLLFGDGAGELRYFELDAGGWTSLERHQHRHDVMVLRGQGRALVGGTLHDLEPFDLVRVPPLTWHQFRAPDDASFGFLCLVDRDRDRPVRPDPAQLAALRNDPELAEFIRV